MSSSTASLQAHLQFEGGAPASEGEEASRMIVTGSAGADVPGCDVAGWSAALLVLARFSSASISNALQMAWKEPHKPMSQWTHSLAAGSPKATGVAWLLQGSPMLKNPQGCNASKAGKECPDCHSTRSNMHEADQEIWGTGMPAHDDEAKRCTCGCPQRWLPQCPAHWGLHTHAENETKVQAYSKQAQG